MRAREERRGVMAAKWINGESMRINKDIRAGFTSNEN